MNTETIEITKKCVMQIFRSNFSMRKVFAIMIPTMKQKDTRENYFTDTLIVIDNY